MGGSSLTKGAGFAAPTILTLADSYGPERGFIATVVEALRARGYNRIVEPCAGSLAMAQYYLAAGYPPDRIETSDVTLFSAALGYAVTGRDLRDLDIKLDGKPLPMTGDPARDAAEVIFTQALAKREAASKIAWEAAFAYDMQTRKEQHVARIERSIRELANRIRGISFELLDIFDHVNLVKDDPCTIIFAAPPSYKSGFERFYSTGGRLTWREPSYTLFDPEVHVKKLIEDSANWKALLLCEQFTDRAHMHGTPVYVRRLRCDFFIFITANHPDIVQSVLPEDRPRAVAIAPERRVVPLPVPVISPTEDITEQSDIKVVSIGDNAAEYYRELWCHRIKGGRAQKSVAVLVNGKVAGVIGYNFNPVRESRAGGQFADAILIDYAFGAPHTTLRLTRLTTMIAASREPLRYLNSWISARVHRAFTIERTRLHEAKGLRGIMKLVSREREGSRYRLTYACEIDESPLGQILKKWLQKEKLWQKTSTKVNK